jgi:hypothetical protein
VVIRQLASGFASEDAALLPRAQRGLVRGALLVPEASGTSLAVAAHQCDELTELAKVTFIWKELRPCL